MKTILNVPHKNALSRGTFKNDNCWDWQPCKSVPNTSIKHPLKPSQGSLIFRLCTIVSYSNKTLNVVHYLNSNSLNAKTRTILFLNLNNRHLVMSTIQICHYLKIWNTDFGLHTRQKFIFVTWPFNIFVKHSKVNQKRVSYR